MHLLFVKYVGVVEGLVGWVELGGDERVERVWGEGTGIVGGSDGTHCEMKWKYVYERESLK